MEMYLGSIIAWPINFNPQNYMYCGGQVLQTGQNQALFALLGDMWGGNGSSTFALPDLRGRVIMGNTSMSSSTPLPGWISLHPLISNANAAQRGAESVILTMSQVPLVTHNHAASGTVTGSFSVTLPAFSGTGQLKATAQSGGTNIPGSNAVPAKIEPLASSGDTINAYGPPDTTTTMPVTVNIPAPANPIPVTGSPSVNVAIGQTGQAASQATPILQPYAVMNYIICTNGLFPSRN